MVLLLQDKGDKVGVPCASGNTCARVRVSFGDGELTAEIAEVLPDGNLSGALLITMASSLRCSSGSAKMPLPPYIKRSCRIRNATRLFTLRSTARRRLPTAGLHFTPEL